MQITFPPDLPVSERRDDIAAAIRDHQVVVVAGETGSGKTTQLPKICLELGRGSDGKLIGHTQPRRIAARSVAERIASELGTELGEEVGYQVRFTDRTSAASRVKLMTDGILLAELQHDRELRKYDTIIIDEAHERSLNIDFILGYLAQLLPRRPDLKVVITSATIETDRFARHFAGTDGEPAPVIEVSGRTYPVEVRYRPLVQEDEADEEGETVVRDQTEAIVDAVRELGREGDGDVLVFLPGEREIRDTADVLGSLATEPRSRGGGFEVLQLFSRLSAAEQHKVFSTGGRRRVVLATNVAETSLTVPGIRYVVDTGLARISRYSLRTKVQRLPIEPVSQASAAQRAGRCGRVADGICIRLYSEEDFEGRPAFTDPEILRTNLASVILQMTSLGLGDVERFGFVDPPDARNVRAGVQLLEELGALRTGRSRRGGRLTGTGRRLARLPVDPRLGRMILEADRLGCLREVLVVTAALSIQDPRERPVDAQARADQLHARFRDPTSDFLGWLNLWRYLREQQGEKGSSAFRRMCREEHLNHLRVREWQELESQLRQIAKGIGMKPGRPAWEDDREIDGDRLHQALLSGLLSQIGLKEVQDKKQAQRGRRPLTEYLGARGTRFAIFPGSGLAKKQPDLVMSAELVETSRLFARQNAAIQPEWAERLGAHLVKRTYAEPHWSARRAQVMARERVTLYGVPLVADRLVGLGKHDPELAREMFIRHALVQGEWHSRQRFLVDNRRLLEEAEELEHRARRRGIVVDEQTLFDFYDARVGAEVVSGAHFDTWWKAERREHPDLLTFDPAMLVHDGAEVDAGAYPDTWQEGALDLQVGYAFEPGADHDGVTVDVPVATLNQVGPAPFTWQVPGLRHELVVALLRSLPKPLRVHFVPAPDVAREFLATVPVGEEPLTEALSRHLRARTGVHVPPEAWDWDKVPAHLRVRFRVLDADGSVVAQGRDLVALAAPLRPSFDAAVAQAAEASGLARTGETAWVFDTIEESFTQVRAGHEVQGFPALDDEGDSVGLVVAGTAEEQEARHRLGVRRLLALQVPSPARRIVDGLDNAGKLGLAGSPYPSVAALVDDCVLAALGDLVDAQEPVRTEAAYEELRRRAAAEVGQRSDEVVARVRDLLVRWRETDKALSGRVELPMLPARNDMAAQLADLVHEGFVAGAGTTALQSYPRYLTALRERLDRLAGDVDRDRQLMDQVVPLQEAWQHRVDALPPGTPPGRALREVRWLLQEYRVSLWAQRLGTAQPVSDARIRKALD
ncbi:ATP-dependent helicase [Marmoricola endophyticus]|uniref:ATP-dependent helicase n=1 Tax=Marmoricola endophyticus TaxID=2040280 RepID=A0A917BCC9_9ACTN|nr:ATP-dependent helicase [Marmoricola endophyticus]